MPTCPACERPLDRALTDGQLVAAAKRLYAAGLGRLNAARRRTHSGGKSGGRKPVPTECPECGHEQPSAKAAREHCAASR